MSEALIFASTNPDCSLNYKFKKIPSSNLGIIAIVKVIMGWILGGIIFKMDDFLRNKIFFIIRGFVVLNKMILTIVCQHQYFDFAFKTKNFTAIYSGGLGANITWYTLFMRMLLGGLASEGLALIFFFICSLNFFDVL